MRIIQAGPFPLDSNLIKGGVESSIYGISQALSPNNEVIVVDYPRYGLKCDCVDDSNGIKVYRFKSKFGNNNALILRVFKVIKTIKKLRPDICHLHSSSMFSLLLFLLLKLNNVAVIITIHGLAHIEKKNNWLKKRNLKNFSKFLVHSFIEFALINWSKEIIVDTEYVANEIANYKKERKIFHLPKIHTIPQGINKLFAEIDCNLESSNILAVGSINPRKGFLELIQAMHKLIVQQPNAFLNIVGIVSDKKYLNEIEAKISELGLSKNIKINTNLSFSQLIEFYKQSSLFVLHTQEESQGIVFCEAMACGMPIVSTNVGGVAFVVDNNKGGLLSNFSDIDTFAENISLLMENSVLKYEFSEYNLKKANDYNWSIIADNVTSVYKKIISK